MEHRSSRWRSVAIPLVIAGSLVLTALMLAPITAAKGGDDHNPGCSDLNSDWREVKVDPPRNGVFSDGILTVEVTGLREGGDDEPSEDGDDGVGDRFNWASRSVLVRAVIVKSGRDASNLYEYDTPGAASGNELQTLNGKEVSHITFCYASEPVPIPELATLAFASTGLVALAIVSVAKHSVRRR